MIIIGLHFECGWDATIVSLDYSPAFYLVRIDRNTGESIDLFFPTAAIRDAVRDAILQCPGCVARSEAEPASAIPEVVGFVSEHGKPIRVPEPIGTFSDSAQPAVADLSPGISMIIGGGGSHAPTTTTISAPQPAVQAKDAAEDWEIPF